MKATNYFFELPAICKKIGHILLIASLSLFNQTIKAGNNDLKIIGSGLPHPPQGLTVTATAYVYPNGYNVSCFGFKDGSITVIVSGGVAPYHFDWNNGSVSQNISNIPAGSYSVKVVDANGLTGGDEIVLTQPLPDLKPEIISEIYEYQNGYNVSCYDCYNGSIDITINGGSGIYSYEWKDGPTTQDRYGLSGGEYSVVIKDASTCGGNQEFFRSFYLKQPEKDVWGMEGNENSNPPDQFIGTIDNKDLLFKTNDSLRLKINANGKIAIGTFNVPNEYKLAVNGKILRTYPF